MRTIAFRLSALVLVLVTASALAGCKKPEDKLVPVTGQVFVDGKPAVGAAVAFHPVESGGTETRPVATVGEGGDFQLTTKRSGDGAAPGDYRVTLTWYVSTPDKRVSEGDDVPARNRLPDKYAKPASTPLTATVRADGTESIRIDIKTGRR